MTVIYDDVTKFKQALKKLPAKMQDKTVLALNRIGNLLRNEIILNITQARLIDTGRLRKSINYFYTKTGKTNGIIVGSFNVPYAAVHEFGINKVVAIRSFQRAQTHAFGKRMKQPRQVTVRGHSKRMNIEGKHYMGKALAKQRLNIIDIMREVFR